MSESRLKLCRLLLDLVVTFIQATLLSVILMMILNLHPYFDTSIILISFGLALVISFIHHILCIDNIYFWKFAFLLPGDIYYYILAKNKNNFDINCCTNIQIELPNDSNLILSKPPKEKEYANNNYIDEIKYILNRFDAILVDCINIILITQCKIKPPGQSSQNSTRLLDHKIRELASGDSESIVLWLHTTSDRTINIIEKNKLLDISYSHCDWNYGNFGILGTIYLILSKNAILLLGRSLLMVFLFFAILLQNPPLAIFVDPIQIQENLTVGQEYNINISAKNIGCDLLNASLKTDPFEKSLIDATWSSGCKSQDFSSGDIDHIWLQVNSKCPLGEYNGMITISAQAYRNKIPDLIPNYNIISPIINQTSPKKLAEVPFVFRMSPKLNLT